MLKVEAKALCKRIEREASGLKVAPMTYGRGKWAVLASDGETVSEYCAADEWDDRAPARSWPVNEVPDPGMPAGFILKTLTKRTQQSARRIIERARSLKPKDPQ